VGRTRCILAVLVVAAPLGGCGDTITKRDYVARADAICASAVRQTRVIPPPTLAGSQAQRLDALAQYFARVLPIAQSELAQLQALKRPSADATDRAVLQRFLATLRQTVGDYRALVTAAQRGDAQGVAAAVARLRASPLVALAARYGLGSCGAPGGTAV